MTFRALLLLLGGSVAAGAGSAAQAEELSIARLFAAPDLSGPSLRAPAISPDGRYVAYLKARDDDRDRLDLWAYDTLQGREVRLVDSTALSPWAVTPSAEEAGRRERQRIAALKGIVEYQFSRDSRLVLVPLDGDLWLCDLSAPRDRAVRRLTATPGAEIDARFSPRGRFVSYVRDGNLYVHDLAAGEDRAITRDGGGDVGFGTAEFVAQEEMDRDTGYWWSPDERRIAYTRVDESGVEVRERFEIEASGTRVVRQRYPATGTPNARVALFVAEVAPAAAAAPIAIDLGPDPDFYLARVQWFPDGRQLAVQRQSRDQKTLTLLAADAATGRARELIVERSDTWVPLHDELTFLPGHRRLVWASERTGFTHLYLYDWNGRLLRPLTRGEWIVAGSGRDRAVKAVDQRRGLLWFTATRDSPIERHLYRLDLHRAGAEPERVTQGAGWHEVRMARDGSAFIDTFSTPEQPPQSTLRDAAGRAIVQLVPNALAPGHPYWPYAAAHAATEFGTLAAADGQVLHWSMLKPRDLQPGRRYPVIVDLYGGPGVQRVRRAWDGLYRQYLVQRGYVVFTLDNRGSGFRGTRFETALHRRLGRVEVQDQVAGVDFLRTLPFVDPARIGVFGWSYGGYLALMCMMTAPDRFAAGVAGAPVTDWTMYDTHYTERYLGTPRDNPAGYADSSVLTHVRGLRGPLLVMHGMADDNVLFTNSTALFAELQRLALPFDAMTYPGGKHALLRRPDMGPHAYATIERFFGRELGVGR